MASVAELKKSFLAEIARALGVPMEDLVPTAGYPPPKIRDPNLLKNPVHKPATFRDPVRRAAIETRQKRAYDVPPRLKTPANISVAHKVTVDPKEE